MRERHFEAVIYLFDTRKCLLTLATGVLCRTRQICHPHTSCPSGSIQVVGRQTSGRASVGPRPTVGPLVDQLRGRPQILRIGVAAFRLGRIGIRLRLAEAPSSLRDPAGRDQLGNSSLDLPYATPSSTCQGGMAVLALACPPPATPQYGVECSSAVRDRAVEKYVERQLHKPFDGCRFGPRGRVAVSHARSSTTLVVARHCCASRRRTAARRLKAIPGRAVGAALIRLGDAVPVLSVIPF